MKIVSIDPFHLNQTFDDCCACIGYFDGIHLGHVQLIQQCIKNAKKKNIKSAFITFHPDPWTVFHKDKNLKHLTTLEDKYKIVESYGIDFFYEIHFSKEFAGFSIDAFHHFLHHIHIQSLVCGFDFRYAYKNSGDIHSLQNQSYFEVDVIDSVNSQNLKISTSRIEPLIEQGNVYEANQLLGYLYSIQGIIEHGFHRGSELLQIPTANLKVNEEYILPGIGVYSGYVCMDSVFYQAMINVGKNPTFDNCDLTIEAHILNFNKDIYGKEVRFFFDHLIREEKKFNSFQDLKLQLEKDIQTTQNELSMDSNLFISTKKIWNKFL